MTKWGTGLVLLALFADCALCGIDTIRVLGPQAVNLWRLNAARTRSRLPGGDQPGLFVPADYGEAYLSNGYDNADDGNDLARKFPAHWFEQPLDHFVDANQTETWKQRYWINTRHYIPRPDSPVFVLDGGETSGMDRLPFLDTGIMEILARATGGIGIVLEHR